jgi:hypothetical protein
MPSCPLMIACFQKNASSEQDTPPVPALSEARRIHHGLVKLSTRYRSDRLQRVLLLGDWVDRSREEGSMFDVERRENGRWIRARAEECRASAFSTSEPELRYSYIQLAECYEALASECDVAADLPFPGSAPLGRNPYIRSSVAGPVV